MRKKLIVIAAIVIFLGLIGVIILRGRPTSGLLHARLQEDLALPEMEGLSMLPTLSRYPAGTTKIEAEWRDETGQPLGTYGTDKDTFYLQKKWFGKWYILNEKNYTYPSLLIPLFPQSGDIIEFDFQWRTDGLKRGEYRITYPMDNARVSGVTNEGNVCCYFSVG